MFNRRNDLAKGMAEIIILVNVVFARFYYMETDSFNVFGDTFEMCVQAIILAFYFA